MQEWLEWFLDETAKKILIRVEIDLLYGCDIYIYLSHTSSENNQMLRCELKFSTINLYSIPCLVKINKLHDLKGRGSYFEKLSLKLNHLTRHDKFISKNQAVIARKEFNNEFIMTHDLSFSLLLTLERLRTVIYYECQNKKLDEQTLHSLNIAHDRLCALISQKCKSMDSAVTNLISLRFT